MQVFFSIIIPFLKKYGIWIVAILGLIILYKKIFLGKRSNVITEYKTNGATITPQQAAAYAESLFNAMDGFGTTNSTIKSIYNILKQNPLNLRAVYNAFGSPSYGWTGQAWLGIWGDNIDLKGWLEKELSPSDYREWNVLFNAAGII